MTTGFASLAEPPSRAGAADVAALAEAVVLGYRQGSDIYQAFVDLGEATSATVTLSSGASTLRLGLAALGVIQLAVDAAAVAVEYVEERDYTGGQIDTDYLTALAASPAFELVVVELSQGSISARLEFLRTKQGRARLLDVLLLASLILTPLVGPVPTMVVTGLVAVNDFTRDRTLEQVQEQLGQVREQVGELTRQLAAQGDIVDALRERMEHLETTSPAQIAAAEIGDVVVEATIAA